MIISNKQPLENIKQMKPSRLSLLSRFCMVVLTLLGFASCNDPFGVKYEYGTPTMDYKIKGTVTDEAGKPIKGIRVVVAEADYDYEHNCFVGDTVYTDAKGKYATSEHTGNFVPASSGLFFDDVDSDANGGSFVSASLTEAELRDAPRVQYKKGDKGWYDGGYEYTVDMTLKKQK